MILVNGWGPNRIGQGGGFNANANLVIGQRLGSDVFDQLSQEAMDKIRNFTQLDIFKIFDRNVVAVKFMSIFWGTAKATGFTLTLPANGSLKFGLEIGGGKHGPVGLMIIHGFIKPYIIFIVKSIVNMIIHVSIAKQKLK